MARWGRQRYWESKVGDYVADWWPHQYDYVTHVSTYVPPKPEHREKLIKLRLEGSTVNEDGYTHNNFQVLDDNEIIHAPMTKENASPQARREQAAILKHYGYGGPVGGGEARALKNLFNAMGKPDLVVYGWADVSIMVMRGPSKYQLRRAQWRGYAPPPPRSVGTVRLQQCHLFKSPLEGVSFDKFVKLARLYKDDSGKLKKAVMAVLANPDAAKEIESLDTLEALANLNQGDI